VQSLPGREGRPVPRAAVGKKDARVAAAESSWRCVRRPRSEPPALTVCEARRLDAGAPTAARHEPPCARAWELDASEDADTVTSRPRQGTRRRGDAEEAAAAAEADGRRKRGLAPPSDADGRVTAAEGVMTLLPRKRGCLEGVPVSRRNDIDTANNPVSSPNLCRKTPSKDSPVLWPMRDVIFHTPRHNLADSSGWNVVRKMMLYRYRCAFHEGHEAEVRYGRRRGRRADRDHVVEGWRHSPYRCPRRPRRPRDRCSARGYGGQRRRLPQASAGEKREMRFIIIFSHALSNSSLIPPSLSSPSLLKPNPKSVLPPVTSHIPRRRLPSRRFLPLPTGWRPKP